VSSQALEIHDAHGHDGHGSHAHQFDDAIQQRDAATLGMWAFLATEVLFFGALFVMYAVFRYRYPVMWDMGSHMLDWKLGCLNTFILLFSSLTMALGVQSAQLGKTKRLNVCLILTLLMAFGFLVVKTFEYHHKFEESVIPGRYFQVPPHEVELYNEKYGQLSIPPSEMEPAPQAMTVYDPMGQYGPGPLDNPEGVAKETTARAPVQPVFTDDYRKLQLFFAVYFAMTGLHGIHVVIGIIMISTLVFLNWKGWFTKEYNTPVEMTGLYWHFVDIVWVFLYPLLYLMDRGGH
jgi:cytochrome c oxidase subunit 3